MRFFSLLAGRHQRVKRLLYMEDAGTSKIQGYFHSLQHAYVIRVHQFLQYALLSNAALISV